MAKKKPSEQSVGKSHDGIVRANLNRRVVVSPSFVSLYANDVQIQTTPWDIRLLFGEVASVPSSDDPAVTIKIVGDVRMSPQLMKKLVGLLTDQLDGYEARFGAIPSVPD